MIASVLIRAGAVALIALSTAGCASIRPGALKGAPRADEPERVAASKTEPLSLAEALIGYGPAPAGPMAVRAAPSRPVRASVLHHPPAAPAEIASHGGHAAPAPIAISPSHGGGGVLFGVHIASYRSDGAAARGWELMREDVPGALDGLRPRVEEIDLGDGEGVFLRLKAGPLANRGEARSRCQALTSAGHYCQPTAFSGRELTL
ncbi:MAG: hypothetical protein MI723_06425 [Caulobacterales bacterium]|nr:hypothetical protein [Caulobacterales bacterium]